VVIQHFEFEQLDGFSRAGLVDLKSQGQLDVKRSIDRETD
jgi:hypothetical protein